MSVPAIATDSSGFGSAVAAAAAVAMAVAALQLSAFLAAAGVDCLLQFGGTQCE